MNRPHMLLIAASVAIANLACAAPASLLEASNPFARESTLPFQFPAFQDAARQARQAQTQCRSDVPARALSHRFRARLARLSDADKQKLKAYNAQLATLQTSFSQNVLKEANASALVVDTRAELAGMAEKAIDAAAVEASKRGLDGKFAVPVVNTTGQAPLSVLTNRTTRQRLLEASMARGSRGGEFDNRNIVLQLARLRAERAALLGYPSHAAYVLEDQTARDTTAVNQLLAEFARPAVANARKEAAEIQQVIDKENGGVQVGAQDWAFYSDKVSVRRFAFDQNQLRPYFEIDNVLTKGVFFAASAGTSWARTRFRPMCSPLKRPR